MVSPLFPNSLCRRGGPAVSQKIPEFVRTLVLDGQRTMIQSTCALCGATRIVSAQDGTIQAWENDHVCFRPAAIADRRMAS